MPASGPPDTVAYATDRLKKRREAARREREAIQPMLDDAFAYAIPFRKSTRNTGKGDNRVDRIFDHTAVDAAFRFAGRLQQDLWPVGQENFALEPGPIIMDEAERERLRLELQPIQKVAQAFFDDSDWDMAFHEMALDLAAGTGAILMNPAGADELDKLWNPISVSIDELLLEQGKDNKISGIFWDRRMAVRVIFETWPEGDFAPELDDLKKQKPEDEIDVHIDTCWNPVSRFWEMHVWCDKQDRRIFASQSRTCPWLTPRYFRVPGETWGRGVLMLAMPTIKTVNTAKRLYLQAAAIAMLGIYTAVDDGVFNPDLAPLEPGMFWKVARNRGSTLGPSVDRFPDPNLQLSDLVVKDMQLDIKSTLLDQALPPETSGAKSALEILERVKRIAADHVGAYGRLVKEFVVPAVKRTIELAYQRKLVTTDVPIDQLLVRVKVKSPLAIAREAQRVEKIVQWLQMVLAVLTAAEKGNRVDFVAKIEEALRSIGHDLGVPPEFIPTKVEREATEKAQADALAAQQAAAVAMAQAGVKGAGAAA